jgi:chromosome segregation ATPase
MSEHRNTPMQNLAVLTNFPPRKPFTPPPISSASSTPTGRKSTLGNPEVLQEKEIAIEALRKKIAEAEAAKALKRARKGANGTATPRTTDSSGDDAKVVDKDMAKKIEASVQIQQKINTAEAVVSFDQKRLAEAHAAEAEKVAELEKSEADHKRLRREQISTELPRVDAEVQKNQLKLELLRSEIARIEAAVQQKLDEKQRMADELERLGREAEDRLQAEKDKLQSLTNAEAASVSGKIFPPCCFYIIQFLAIECSRASKLTS